MNVVPGSSFFQTVQGSAASNGPVKSSPPAENTRATENPVNQQAKPLNDGPRGRIVDIVV